MNFSTLNGVLFISFQKSLLFLKNIDIIKRERMDNKKMKFRIRMILLISILFLVYFHYGKVQATTIDTNLIREQMENYTKNIDGNNITKEDILRIYDEISEQYSPENIADLIEENAEEIEEQGIRKEIVKAGAEFIRQTDAKSIRNMIENEIDMDDIQEKIEKGYTAEQILTNIVEETPSGKKVELVMKILLSNKIIKTAILVISILWIYGTILRWRIYQKAGKPGWAAIVPFYRQIVMYQVCDLSPWLMLLWLLPIIGWMAMLVIAIMKRFCLAKEFGRSALFGFGLLLLAPIFQSILAFHPLIEKIEKEA